MLAVLQGGSARFHKGLGAWKALSTLRYDGILRSPPLMSLDLAEDWDTRFDQDQGETPASSASQLTASLLNGKAISEEIISEVATEVSKMKTSIGKVPGLAVLLASQRRECQTYVRNKVLACEEAGIRSEIKEFPEHCSEDDILGSIKIFNQNPEIHGILVQLPLPQHLNEERILSMLPIEKDVDGFHPLNMGEVAMRGREPQFISCTPKGCIELLLRYGVEIEGKRAVVIGRSNIVGLPASLLLQRYHATVTVVNAFTENQEEIARQADIIISAVGMPNLVRGSWLKPGAIVIDVGTYPIEDPTSEHGYRLIGDVCYEEAVKVASAITPVPGGVGPMTIAMLLCNTLEAAKRTYNFY